jgi:hypothetical protein
MIALSSAARVYLACGVTDMRKGMVGLAMIVQQSLTEDLRLPRAPGRADQTDLA